ncbi:hypothetical protein Tco_0274751, partial [Tanacetum coccineum]
EHANDEIVVEDQPYAEDASPTAQSPDLKSQLSSGDFDALEAELQQAHTQISKLQRKQIGCNHKISLARYRIAELGEVINDMETRHQADIENLMDSIIELKNRME